MCSGEGQLQQQMRGALAELRQWVATTPTPPAPAPAAAPAMDTDIDEVALSPALQSEGSESASSGGTGIVCRTLRF